MMGNENHCYRILAMMIAMLLCVLTCVLPINADEIVSMGTIPIKSFTSENPFTSTIVSADSVNVSTLDSGSVGTGALTPMFVSQSLSGINYVTPEQFGAKGDGVTDDSDAFEKCMKSGTRYVYLSGTYLITRYLTAPTDKYFYARPKRGYAGASIICNPRYDTKTLSFTNVIFENVEFYSTLLRQGNSPHGEPYDYTSNTVFVEIWNGTATFENCHFLHGVVAIRGRKSSDSTVIPQNIRINRCSFTECKIPVQGYCRNTVITGSTFINDGELFERFLGAAQGNSAYNGDVYSGDHCVYMEAYGCESVLVQDCKVSTLNTESGASFQIYGKQASGDSVPSLTIESCVINSNGVASASIANLTVRNTTFTEQTPENYIIWIEKGSAILEDSEFNHAYAFSYSSSSVKPYAKGCTFRLLPELSNTRCNFPYSSTDCTYVNWGGNVRLNGTSFTDCTFTRESLNSLSRLYISNKTGYKLSLTDTAFRKGSTITDNTAAVTTYTGCSTFS